MAKSFVAKPRYWALIFYFPNKRQALRRACEADLNTYEVKENISEKYKLKQKDGGIMKKLFLALLVLGFLGSFAYAESEEADTL